MNSLTCHLNTLVHAVSVLATLGSVLHTTAALASPGPTLSMMSASPMHPGAQTEDACSAVPNQLGVATCSTDQVV